MNIKANVSHHEDGKQDRRIRRAKRRAQRAHERIEALKEWIGGLAAKNIAQDGQFNSLKGLIDTVLPIATQALLDLEEGLLAIQAVLEDEVSPAFDTIEAALEAIDAALNDTTTGLVGLNLARPQFAALAADATFLGGTGAAGGLGPVDDTDTFVGADLTGGGGPDLEGTYVVDFNNDVSERMYTVNVFPAGPGVATPTGSAANCSVSGIDTVCGLVQTAGPADADPNKVLIQINDGDTPHPAGFSVTALSG